LTEREYEVNRSTVLSGTVVIVDDKELDGLCPMEIRSLIIDKANQEDNWQSYEELGDDTITYEVSS
tara:strand:- start:370 stop:567 length:198 start_codon:yes stop_codon:yes gene_type:complete